MPNLEKDRHTETIRKSSFNPVESDHFQIGPWNRRFRSDAYGALSIDWTTYRSFTTGTGAIKTRSANLIRSSGSKGCFSGDRRQALLVGGSIVFFTIAATGQVILTFWGIIHLPVTASLSILVLWRRWATSSAWTCCARRGCRMICARASGG